MSQQFVGRIIESSAPGLTEMFVRGDTARFSLRFTSVVIFAIFLATLGAAGLVAGNTAFVVLWTSGAIHWNLACDALLAGLLITTSLTRCLMGLFGLAGNLRPIRHIYFFEGCVFIALAIPASSHFGAFGLLLVSLLTHLAVTTILSLRASTSILMSVKGILLSALASVVVTSCVLIIFFWSTIFITRPITIFFIVPLLISFAALCGWFFILPTSLRDEVGERFLKIIPMNIIPYRRKECDVKIVRPPLK